MPRIRANRTIGALVAAGAVMTALLAPTPASAARPAAPPSPPAAADRPPEIPVAAPPAATTEEPALPAASGWPLSEEFPRTSGTARYDDGALLWTDWLFDDTGDGSFTYADARAHSNGADVFRAGVGVRGPASYWRVDFTTLADGDLPLAVWALDTDADPATGTAHWPARAGVESPGSDAFLIVSSRGVRLQTASGDVRDLTAEGATLSVDEDAGSFVVEVPRALLRVNGRWRVRLATGLADASGFAFAPAPQRSDMRVYNAAFRTAEQEGERRQGPQAATAWDNGAQSAALVGGDVAPFSLQVDWRRLARGEVQSEPVRTGFSTRWYASSVDLGPGVHPEVRQPSGQPPTTAPRVYGRVQPYLVYVPTGYSPERPAPLTLLLHGGGGNHNAYRGAGEEELYGPVCEDRGSICVAPLGRGDGTWYVNEAELDVWEVWHRVADAYALDGARTVVAGHSMGGVGATRLAANHPDVFAAVGIVSGAGYRNAAGVRDDEEDPLRVENLSNMTVFMDAGTADIAEGNTRTWGAAFEAAGVPHLVHYYAGATHDDFGRLGWRELAGRIDGAVLHSSPARIAFRWDPREDRPDLGLTADSAHWIDGLSPRDPDARWSRVSARSGALDTTATEPELRTASAVYGRYVTEVRELTLRPVGAVPPAAELRLDLTNVATATVHLDAAGLGKGPVTVRVRSDGDTRITVRRGGGEHAYPVPAGDHVLTVGRPG